MGAVADRNAFPLHRRTWSFAQLWAYPTGIVVASSIAVIGVLSVVGLVQRGEGGSAALVALAASVVALGAFRVGRRLGGLGGRTGVVVIHPDRIVIVDDQLLDGPIVLTRGDVLDVSQPGVSGSGPFGSRREDSFVARLVRGDARP